MSPCDVRSEKICTKEETREQKQAVSHQTGHMLKSPSVTHSSTDSAVSRAARDLQHTGIREGCEMKPLWVLLIKIWATDSL